MDLLALPGPSGQEGKVAALVKARLKAAGCRASWIKHDDAHKRIGKGFTVGNLIVKLPGTRRGARRMFAGHLDTVPLCRGAVPVRKGGRIVSRGETALGADNRTAVACLVTLAETLLADKASYPPLTLLFTVGEEIGLHGAKAVRKSDLGNPRMGFNIDSGLPEDLLVAAIGAARWTAEVKGRSAHAGVHPEHGISAILIAARAIEEVARKGYFGKIVKGRRSGTSNVGSIAGGEASNQVTDRVTITGECRSHDPVFLKTIVKAYDDAFRRAARSVSNSDRKRGSVAFNAQHDYDAFSLDSKAPVVSYAMKVARSMGLSPLLSRIDGGLDANYFNKMGIPTITFGAGQHHPHTVDEYADIEEYLGGCRLAVGLATSR